jgi:hypothetical protein
MNDGMRCGKRQRLLCSIEEAVKTTGKFHRPLNPGHDEIRPGVVRGQICCLSQTGLTNFYDIEYLLDDKR